MALETYLLNLRELSFVAPRFSQNNFESIECKKDLLFVKTILSLSRRCEIFC